jgi:alkylhydroperoxidase family enzyme
LQDPHPELHEALARADLDAAPLPEAERALLRFVALVTRHAHRTSDADVEGLRAAGWTDAQIAECVYITALFAFFNRVADAFGLEDPNYFDHPPPRGGEPARPGTPPT